MKTLLKFENKKTNSLFSSTNNLIKSKQSLYEIKKLNNTLSKIEQNCNQNVAEKYLAGYLENKGARSFNDFLSKLT